MNSTASNVVMTGEGYGYATIILGVLFVLSEVLPFVKKHKGNGVCDTLVCMLRGSSCLATKLADVIEEKKGDETADENV
tara:strand:+ start:1138 stop:1374 length:237 start_codon:yes stop_codon:yes gene_type:complete